MLIFKENINPIYFVHIPRTGGRYVRELFLKNNYSMNFFRYEEKFLNKEIPHLHYPYYNKFTDNGKIPQFTIIRNPVDRFISMIHTFSKKDDSEFNVEEILKDEKLLFNFINEQIMYFNYSTNWFLPQFHFINPNCKIWKYEDGLGKEFYKWLRDTFNIDITDENVTYEKSYFDEYKKIELKKETIEYIKKYYEYDYKIFNY
jgi:hypothetical protein